MPCIPAISSKPVITSQPAGCLSAAATAATAGKKALGHMVARVAESYEVNQFHPPIQKIADTFAIASLAGIGFASMQIATVPAYALGGVAVCGIATVWSKHMLCSKKTPTEEGFLVTAPPPITVQPRQA